MRKPVGGGGPKATGVAAIPAGDLKRYRMLENKILPLRKALDRDGARMIGSTDYKRRDAAAAKYDLNNRRLNRVTDTMRKLSNSPDSPNIPRLPRVTKSGRRLGRTNAIKKMDGPRKFGGQSYRDLRGQYSQGRVQYHDNYMDKTLKRNKGQGIKRMSKIKATISKPRPKPQASIQPRSTASRTRKQAASAYKARVNQMGKLAASQRGFVAAMARGQRGGFTPSDQRSVYRRGKNQQRTIFGGTETVRTGRMRLAGTRNDQGKVKPLKPARPRARRRKPS